jgi:ribosomal protein S18 acetylase RimI-like enzyme
MEALQSGHYWKTPFIWEPGCPEPVAAAGVHFEEATDEWLATALAEVLSHSLDEADQYTVTQVGAAQAVSELLAILPQYFHRPAAWWRTAVDAQGRKVGFVLPVIFKDQSRWKDGRPQGTIFYTGVLPEFRGCGYARTLLDEATRVFIRAECWRIFCDTGTNNAPMVNAFRQAGYKERTPWQRPVA